MHTISQIDRWRFRFAALLRLSTGNLDGLTLWTDPAHVPKEIRRGIFRGDYEWQERRLLRQSLTSGDRVLDLGSCVGVVAILAAMVVGSKNVLTYEANPALEPIIRKNFALNGVTPALRMRAATTDGRKVALHLPKRVFSSSFFERDAEKGIVVSSDALSGILLEFQPTVVTMDVEGAEVELLTGNGLRGVSKLIVEFQPGIVGDDAVARSKERLRQLGFSETAVMGDVGLFVR